MPTLETVRFRFRSDLDDAARDEAVAASSRFLAEQPGYRRRLVARRDNGEILDLVEWEGRSQALAAAEVFPKADAAAQFIQSIEPASAEMGHLELIHRHEVVPLAELLAAKLRASREFFERSTSVLTDEHEGFRPREEMLTVAQQVAHAASSVDWFTEGAFSSEGFDLDFEAQARWVAEQSSLSGARTHLGEAFDRAIERFGAAAEDALRKALPPGPIMGGKPRWSVVSGVEEHTAHHRGSLAVYARLLGLVPPMPYAEG